VTTDSVV